MICKNCGNQVADGMKFCPECGRAMTAQPDETLTGEIVETQGNASGNSRQNTAENVGKVMDQAKDIKRKYNTGHLGVLISSILAVISIFVPNLAADGNIISLLTNTSISQVIEGSDGRTYALILIVLLLFTVALAYFRKNLVLVVASITSTVWIMYMFYSCGYSILRGMGLLLLPVSGILLVVSSIAAFSIGRKQQA